MHYVDYEPAFRLKDSNFMRYRFSGHETFPCRYAWLPKAFEVLNSEPKLFNDDEKAMIALGVGKNMVRAIRFWVQVIGIAERTATGGYNITKFGKDILSVDGFDPFLEDRRTLWLIHWNLSTLVEQPLYAWDYLLNQWHQPEIIRRKVIQAFSKGAEQNGRKLSKVTLEQHFDTFLHTYFPTRGRKGDIQEDNLDCPLVELEFLQKTGERKSDDSARREDIYAFRREEKPDISAELFIYFIHDYWKKRRGNEKTLSFRDISVGHGSPGQILKLPEQDIRNRLETIQSDSSEAFIYKESTSFQQIIRGSHSLNNPLEVVYNREALYA